MRNSVRDRARSRAQPNLGYLPDGAFEHPRFCNTDAEPLTQGCFGLMVCVVPEAIRWNYPLQTGPETLFLLWLLDAARDILCHGTKSTPSDRRGSTPRRGRSGERHAEVVRFRGIFRVAPPLA